MLSRKSCFPSVACSPVNLAFPSGVCSPVSLAFPSGESVAKRRERSSAAKAKRILRAKFLTLLAFPSGESVAKRRERAYFSINSDNFLSLNDLYRLGFASLSEPLSPKGKARNIDISLSFSEKKVICR